VKPLFVQWGGGNIGRSFIAQVFAHAGFRVIIIDINQGLVDALNREGCYTIESVFEESVTTFLVEDVSAIHASNQAAVNMAIAEASFLGVSVGRGAWPHIAASLAEAISYRHAILPENQLDIILAENIHRCKDFAKSLLLPHLNPLVHLDAYVGLVETSIGKMVPIQESNNFLTLRCEPYNELILDAKAFHHPLPLSADILAVSPIEAYVDRKLFIHNMGHSATAYIGYILHPDRLTIAEVLQDNSVRTQVEDAMYQSRDVLLTLHPGVFSKSALDDHIHDLLRRFSNHALADTVHRVGRDLKRKLRFDDRLLGIIIEAEKLGMRWESIGRAYLLALSFDAPDHTGKPYPQDILFLQLLASLEWLEKIRIAASWDESTLDTHLLEGIAEKLRLLQ